MDSKATEDSKKADAVWCCVKTLFPVKNNLKTNFNSDALEHTFAYWHVHLEMNVQIERRADGRGGRGRKPSILRENRPVHFTIPPLSGVVKPLLNGRLLDVND